MRGTNLILICSLTIALLLGCGFSTEKRRPKAIEEELAKRDVKILSDAEILASGKKIGDSITMLAQVQLMELLSKKIKEGDFDHAVNFCSEKAQALTDSIGNAQEVLLKRVSLKNRNPSNKPDSLQAELLEAYAFSAKQGTKLSSNLQLYSNGDSILYNKPIFLASNLCLNCHGAENDLSNEVKQILANKYPNDKATGYALGDFRGLWSVKFSKKQLVNQL